MQSLDRGVQLLLTYTGQFCPEFEYEEWAISWRARVHALFLELASSTIDKGVFNRDLASARNAAVVALEQDPSAYEIERKLVWLYWHLGSRSAALAQHEHMAGAERRDVLDVTPLETIVQLERP